MPPRVSIPLPVGKAVALTNPFGHLMRPTISAATNWTLRYPELVAELMESQ